MAASAVALVSIGGVGLWASKSTAIDTNTGCPVSHKTPDAHTVLLIDETDKLTKSDLDYARSVVMNEYYWLPIGGRLTVRNILSDTQKSSDIVICRLDDGSRVLGIMKNPRKLQRDFDRIAGVRLQKLLADIAAAPVQQQSPLVESISEVSDRPDFGKHVPLRRFVMISDMVQHSDEFTQYGKSVFNSNISYYSRDLTNVSIRIHYIARRSLQMQGPNHKKFWMGYFRSMGATDVRIGHDLLLGEDPKKKEVWSDVPT